MLAAKSISDIIDRYTQAAPTDMEGLARAFDIEVSVIPLPENISGSISRSRFGSSFSIQINAAHSRTRQRFTLAHEIAHFVLHRDMIGDGIVDDAMYRSDRSDEIEAQANGYAASLLMPAPLVRRYFRQGVRSFAGMASTFDVSTQVARLRMIELRLGG